MSAALVHSRAGSQCRQAGSAEALLLNKNTPTRRHNETLPGGTRRRQQAQGSGTRRRARAG